MFKIITKKKIQLMLEEERKSVLKSIKKEEVYKTAKYTQMERDITSLRKQNLDLNKEISKLLENKNNSEKELDDLRKFKNDTIMLMENVDLAGLCLSICRQKCKKCDHEQRDCRKYEFGEHKYCVTKK